MSLAMSPPAQAGVQESSVRDWIPASAGMTWASVLLCSHSTGGSKDMDAVASCAQAGSFMLS
jgi:hypothetical protein